MLSQLARDLADSGVVGWPQEVIEAIPSEGQQSNDNQTSRCSNPHPHQPSYLADNLRQLLSGVVVVERGVEEGVEEAGRIEYFSQSVMCIQRNLLCPAS